MPGVTAGGRAERGQEVTLKASGAQTASTTGAGIEVAEYGDVRLKLDVTAASGTTPTLDITIETSFDDGATDAYRSIGTFAQKAGVASERKDFNADRWVRYRSVIAGTTPSFTYSITGEAV